MRQLQLFTTAELATMRDRTRSRKYSPEKDEFRREHERHRSWGLKRRHAERQRHVQDRACAAGSAGREGKPSYELSPSRAKPSYELSRSRVRPSHELSPSRVRPSHELSPSRVRPSHELSPSRVKPSHELSPSRAKPSHQ